MILVACGGLTQSPADGLNFRAPNAWGKGLSIMGRAEIWDTGEGKYEQGLVLLKMPPGTKLDKSFDLHLVDGLAIEGGGKIVSRRQLTLCGNQPSVYVMMRGESSRRKIEENLAAVFSKATDATYLAMYEYPVGASPDPRAQEAIYELCRSKSLNSG